MASIVPAYSRSLSRISFFTISTLRQLTSESATSAERLPSSRDNAVTWRQAVSISCSWQVARVQSAPCLRNGSIIILSPIATKRKWLTTTLQKIRSEKMMERCRKDQIETQTHSPLLLSRVHASADDYTIRATYTPQESLSSKCSTRDNITQLSLLLFYPTMRPQSAKPGHKGQWGQSSAEDIADPHPPAHLERKQVRIMRPDLTTHDFARILPRRIQQDKERLYSEGLQLKQALHEVAEENVRLKTKIAVIEREKDKLGRFVETAPEGLGKASRLQGRSEKDNMVVRNLKKLVREGRDESDALRAETQKIKKTIKYTKINELEIERKVLADENKRIATMLEQYSAQFVDQQDLERENEELKKYLEQEIDEKNQIDEEREKYEEIIDSLEDKIKTDADKHQAREKKLQRDLQTEKRRAQDLQRKNDELYRELKSLRESQQFLEQRQQQQRNSAKPNIRTSKVQKTYKVNTQQSQPSFESEKKYVEIRRHNEELSKELQAVKEKLKKAQEASSHSEERSKVNINHSNLHLSHEDDFEEEPSPSKEHKREPSKAEEEPEEEYEQAFDNEPEGEAKESKNEQQIQLLKKDFEENEEEEELYKKEEKPKKAQKDQKPEKSQKGQKQKGKAQKGKGKGTKGKGGKAQAQAFKPDKKILSEIKQLLTYRMKSQRYPFSDIKSDIQSAQTTQFSYSDLCNMLVNEPFYLTADYTRAFLSYCFDKQRVQAGESIASAVLVGKLRRVIDDFEMMEESEEKEMIIRIAEMTSTYPRELQVAFENIKNGEETVGRQDLIDMFKKLELEDKYIDLIIAELSLCSDDLEHLNFHGFFERFYIEDEGEEYLDNNAIEEEESEESYKHSSRVRKQAQRPKDGQGEEEDLPNDH